MPKDAETRDGETERPDGEGVEADRIDVVGAAIVLGSRCLAALRSANMALPLQWEFPGGKVAEGESPEDALVREIAEELGLEIRVGEWLAEGRDDRGEPAVVLQVYRAELVGGALHLDEHREIRWVDAEELDDLDWAVADLPAVEAVRGLLRSRS